MKTNTVKPYKLFMITITILMVYIHFQIGKFHSKTITITGEMVNTKKEKLEQIIVESAQYLDYLPKITAQKIQTMPWVKTSTIKKITPNTFQVNITEKKAVAMIDKFTLVDEEGNIFKLNTPFLEERPHINCEKKNIKVCNANLQKVQKALDKLNLKVKSISFYNKWEILLGSETKLVYGMTEPKLKLIETIKVLNKTASNKSTVEKIDFRYIDGAAVKLSKNHIKKNKGK